MVGDSWTHKMARVCVLPLVNTPVTPNHLTTLRLMTGLFACGLFAIGTVEANLYGGWLWILSAFLDRADGELARVSGKTSTWGHQYDYCSDLLVTALFFVGIGISLQATTFWNVALGSWTIAMGGSAAVGVVIAGVLAEKIDQAKKHVGEKAYPSFAGFDFDDILYLFAPVVWLDLHLPFLLGASMGAPAFAVLTWYRAQKI